MGGSMVEDELLKYTHNNGSTKQGNVKLKQISPKEGH